MDPHQPIQEPLVSTSPHFAEVRWSALPTQLRPTRDASVDALVGAIDGNPWLKQQVQQQGAVLLRGFPIDTIDDFSRVAEAFTTGLQTTYPGVVPRKKIRGFVHNSTELSRHYPIPQHCEMSFSAEPPRHLLFGCMVAPPKGGETPLADFRSVWAALPTAVRQRFERGGLRIVRNYDGPATRGLGDPMKYTTWDSIFKTTDRDEVALKVEALGWELRWCANDRLRLISTQEVTRVHPPSGLAAWHTHLTSFHIATGEAEFRHLWQRDHKLKHGVLALALAALTRLRRRFTTPDEFPTHCTYRDGSEIPSADIQALREVIWHNTTAFRWQRGDLLLIDNLAVSHGRNPYRGPRQIVVAWA